MMTGVFHFMAISFALILAGGRVGSPTTAVNQERRQALRCRYAILFLLAAPLGVLLDRSAAPQGAATRVTVLVFPQTTAFRHDSIPQGIAAIEELGAEHGFALESTEDAARFSE